MYQLAFLRCRYASPIVREARRAFHASRKCQYYIDGPQEPFSPMPGRFPKWASNGDETFGFLKDGANVFIHGGAATPSLLIKELYEYVMSKNLKDIKLFHIHTEGPYPFNDAEGHFRSTSLFTGGNCRKAIQEGRADYTPIFLSEIPLLFRRKHVQLDLALINVTPPDKHGFCSLGPSVDVTRAAIQNATHIVAQVNDQLPLTRGDASIHFSNLTVMRAGSQPCHEMSPRPASEVEDKIGQIIAENLVEDGATLQTGTFLTNIPRFTICSSGFGGQVDFLRGAAVSLDGQGKPIIAVPSVTKRNETKIVPHLKLGGGVVTTRAHVHYVVTEYGIAYLFGKNLRQRAHALIQIAHPDHRESLEKAAFDRLKVMPSPD
ncbi:4-hydroxybutyrate coenzyme A transferase [Fasciola hepatica]|uniref:4-hydroxybutyrate coenzyme A transferase n=1 Tax=Fasciola hepatica TaxID=6192 RepID=A0A4E0QVH7_FASHE|nr:4-hydroxybutyrate coenzyme A transferase [Fasciola hepatica]